MIVKYATSPRSQGQVETHKNYIDVQFVLDGEESLLYEHVDRLALTQPYAEAKDVALYTIPDDCSEIRLRKGMFAILFPEDGHVPGRMSGKESPVHKLVFKVAVEK